MSYQYKPAKSQVDHIQESLNRREGQARRRAEEAENAHIELRNKVRIEGRKLRKAGIATHRCSNCGINACIKTERFCTPECQHASERRMKDALAQAEPAIQELFDFQVEDQETLADRELMRLEAIELRKRYPFQEKPITDCLNCGRPVCTEDSPYCCTKCERIGTGVQTEAEFYAEVQRLPQRRHGKLI